jgi:hypothetical protein
MKKRLRTAVLNTIEAAGANVINASGEWGIVETSAGNELLLGMFRDGNLKSVESFDPVAENPEVVLLGASATKETIAAETRYKVEIGNPDDKYETEKRWPVVHAYTTATALSGNADTDRLNVYTALVNKINGYAGNNCTAYLVHEFDFTLGGATGNDALPVGTTITQQTSGATAVVGKIALSGGTFAGGDAAGTIWVYNDQVATITDGALTWSWATSTLTQTNATLVLGTGLACVDDSGYFTSSLARPGANWYGATQGFSVSQFELAEAPVYAEGIGSDLAALVTRYDHSKQDAIEGNIDYELQAGASFDTAKTYRKYIFNVLEGDEDAMGGDQEHSYQQVVLFADYASGNLGDLDTAIGNLT